MKTGVFVIPAFFVAGIGGSGCAATRLKGTVEMKRTWPIIAVSDVPQSSGWYTELLDARETHPGGTVFNQIVAEDGTTLVALHHWGPSGRRGDHHWPSLSDPGNGNPGNGLLLWFVVDDFDQAWRRAQSMGAVIEETPNTDNGTGMRAFVVRDPDGYYAAVNERRND